MKNLLTMAVIIAVSTIIFFEEHAAAQDVYVGKFSDKDVYLITESLSGSSKDNFKCVVRVVDRVSELIWRYEFFRAGASGEMQYTLIMNTGYRYTSNVFDGQSLSQPAVRILRYVQANY